MIKNQRSEKPQNKKKITIPVFVVLSFTMVIIISIFIYTKFFKLDVTFIGGFNWLDEDIIIAINGEEQTVEPMDMFSLKIYKRGELIVKIKNMQDQTIRENMYYLNGIPASILELATLVEENQCVVKADVSNIYYKTKEEATAKDIIALTDSPTESFYYELTGKDINLEYYVYPGHYSQEFLPEQLPQEMKVIGLFFVDCGNLEDDKKLQADILGSIYYE